MAQPCSKSGWKISPGLAQVSVLQRCSLRQLSLSTSKAQKRTSHKASCRRVLLLFWPHPSKWSPNLSKICPQEQRLEPKSARKVGCPTRCATIPQTLYGAWRGQCLGLGIARSHAPACCADIVLSRAQSRKHIHIYVHILPSYTQNAFQCCSPLPFLFTILCFITKPG